MKKNFFYMALGLVGIMGALSIGVADAAWTISYGNTETSATLLGDNNIWNDNFKYKTIKISSGTTSYVLMDRNLGSTVPWDGTTCPSETNGNNESTMAAYYGYYYQWGNNWGFSATTKVGNTGSEISTVIPSNYVSSIWSTADPWNSDHDLWGGKTNTEGARRGPCPSGWHVPSSGEWQAIYDAWDSSSNKTTSGFVYDLRLPPAGTRKIDLIFQSRGTLADYWSSDSYNDIAAYRLTCQYGSCYPKNYNKRSIGRPVRCLQNSPTRTVTFTANGETFKTVDVKRGSTVSQPSPAPTTSNGTFQAWYKSVGATTAFSFSTAINADTKLFAKFTCSAGYQLKSDWSGCEAISYTVTYNKTENGGEGVNESDTVSYNGQADLTKIATKEGYDFLGWNTDKDAHAGLTTLTVTQDTPLYAIFSKTLTGTYTATHASIAGGLSDTCTMYNKETSCSITLPLVTCDAGYHTPAWSPDNLNGITSNQSATVSCTACGNGTYTEAGNTATSCTQCEAGYYCPAGSAKAECTGQTQFSTEGASACSNVMAGYYTTGCDGSNNKCTGQVQCTAGTYCVDGVQHDCVASTDTQAGTYSSTAGATSCTTASNGYYVATDSAISQTQCTAGNYCVDGKIISCTTLGTEYTSDAGASAESECYKTLTATFNENGATLSNSSATCKLYYGSGSCPIVAPTITAAAGFTALGFNTDANATNGTTPTSISADATYYAITQSTSPIQIIFDINGNGGTTSTGECYRYNGSGSCSVTSPDITPANGFTAIGWNSNPSTHSSEWNTGTAKTVSESATYYAQSEKAGYQVTASYIIGTGVSAIGATSGKCNVDTIYNGSGYLPCNIILTTIDLKPGYNTGVWSTGNNVLNPGSGISLLSDDIYTASATPNTYTVKFEAGEGTGTMSNQEFTYDISQNLTGNAFTKTGYIFSGWTDGITGYTDKQNVSNLTTTDGETVTLTAQWTPITYSIEFTGTDVSGTMANQDFEYDSGQALNANAFTKTGYIFSGWIYGNTGYANQAEVLNLTGTSGAVLQFIAQWTPITYSIEFTGTDVSGTMANQDFEYDSVQALNTNAFTKTGYEFSGWTYGTTGYTNQQNVINLTTTNNDIITFTAQWTPITYTISFSGNSENATGTAPATINAEYDSGDIAPDNSFILTGYTFTGWNTESDGSGTGYATGGELKNLTTTSGLDVVLYAQWEVNVHKLNFVVDGTNIQSGDVAYSSGISAFLPSEPKKDCNSFAGWTSSVEGLTTTGTMPDSDVTLTANWDYTCSRSSGGGGGGSSRNTEKTTETQTGSKVDSSTKATDNEDNTQDSSAKASEGQNQGKTYSDEFQQAYEFAYKHGITTMPTIEQANMEGPLTRIAMAKMLSYYAINVLGLKPDETRVNKFNDVSDQMDAEYNNAVSLAYQLGIMGINMPKNKFRPNDLVTRAEFATALSRMLYKIADGKDKYYSTHMAKLMEEKIITNDNPNLQELRGYVMIMLMRSAK